jgi:hypothetical protein
LLGVPAPALRFPNIAKSGATVVPLYRLLEKSAYGPEMIEAMSLAFDEACASLGLAKRADPLRELVAHKIIEFAVLGERDPIRLRDQVLAAFRS